MQASKHSSQSNPSVNSLAEKLNPQKLGFSPKMAYLLQAIIGHDYGVRDGRGGFGSSISITSDGFVVVSTSSHESGAFIGAASDLTRNLNLLLAEANLSPEQKIEFDNLYKTHVTDWRN